MNWENYTGFMLFALVAGVFAAFGFYMGRIYQNYLIDKAQNKPTQDNNLTEKLNPDTKKLVDSVNKLLERNRKLEENSRQLEEKCQKQEQLLREK